MSCLPEAEFFISVDTSQMIDGSQKAKQIFAEISNSGLQSMNTIQTQTDIQAEIEYVNRHAAMSLESAF